MAAWNARPLFEQAELRVTTARAAGPARAERPGRGRPARAPAGSRLRRAAARAAARSAGRRRRAGFGRRRFREAARRRLSARRRQARSTGGGGSRISTCGSTASITSRPSPSSASGTFHWNASSRPLAGDTGIQRSETRPSAVQAGSRAACSARAIHSRARPSSPLWRCSSSAISSATRWVGCFSNGLSALRAIANSSASMRGARHRERALGVIRAPAARGSARASAARARNRPGADAHRRRRDRDADWPARPSR